MLCHCIVHENAYMHYFMHMYVVAVCVRVALEKNVKAWWVGVSMCIRDITELGSVRFLTD